MSQHTLPVKVILYRSSPRDRAWELDKVLGTHCAPVIWAHTAPWHVYPVRGTGDVEGGGVAEGGGVREVNGGEGDGVMGGGVGVGVMGVGVGEGDGKSRLRVRMRMTMTATTATITNTVRTSICSRKGELSLNFLRRRD